MLKIYRSATTAQGGALRSPWLRAPPQNRQAIFSMCYGTHFTTPGNVALAACIIKEAIAAGETFRAYSFESTFARNDIDHRLTKPRHPWTNGQVERVNRTIMDATVKRYQYDRHEQLRAHLADFFGAYNFGLRLKTLCWLKPYEAICKACSAEPGRFRSNSLHHMQGPSI